jgi:hypothetical protein
MAAAAAAATTTTTTTTAAVQLVDVREPLRTHIARHLTYAAEIQHTLAVREHLIDQFHTKKGTLKRAKFVLTDTTTTRWYLGALFLRYKLNTSLQVLPSNLQCVLDSLIFLEADSKTCTRAERELLMDVHYNWSQPVLGDAKRVLLPPERDLSADGWLLDAVPHMTPNDILVLGRYTQLLDNLFGHVIELVQATSQSPIILREIVREQARLQRIVRSLI